MAKVTGSYPSVTLGVSEQVPHNRRPGQYKEQVNFISDPVNGLARRHGSVMQDEVVLGDYGSPAAYGARLRDTARHKSTPFFVAGDEYDIIYRTTADNETLGQSTFAWCFDKERRKFLPVVYHADDPALNLLVAGGVSASVSVGKYIYLAGNAVVPTWEPTDNFGAIANKQKLAVWVRGGAYARTFTVSLIRANGTKVTATYKTKTSSYPELLDLSDIPVSDPDYQNKVNKRVAEYNSLVTEWIGIAAADQTPENIAAKLREALVTAGVSASTIQVVGGTIVINNADFVEVEADDSGDQTLIRAVGNSVTAPDLVSTVHWVGKIVKVKPKQSNGSDALYLKAVAKEEGQTGWAEVAWEEAAGYVMQPETVFIMGTVKGGTLYLASSAARLQSMTGDEHPEFKANAVGDDITTPIPFFFGKRISYLGLFQDRLVIGSGSTLFFSKPGDYFNWFRGSVLTIADNDPVEIYALGSEDDTISASTTYDRNLFLFGKRLQYAVNGRQPLTPRSASIVIMSAHEDAVDADPQNSGNFVFYSKTRDGYTSVHQIQMGLLADNPESYNVSQQLDRYIVGRAVEIIAVTAPNVVLLRTEGNRQRLYTYTYMDSPTGAERLFDAWSKWEWAKEVGDIIGLSRHDGDVLVYTLRHGLDSTGARKVWVACEQFVLDSGLSSYPHLDSLRPTRTVTEPTASSYINPNTESPDISVAYGAGSDLEFIGTRIDKLGVFVEQYPDAEEMTYCGFDIAGEATPTNPFVRDRNDRAIVNGRLTLGKVTMSVADTGGMLLYVGTANGEKLVTNFNGRLLGRAANQIGRQPIVTTSVSGLVGREVRQCWFTIKPKRWLPLTVTAIEWSGQWFNNSRRV